MKGLKLKINCYARAVLIIRHKNRGPFFLIKILKMHPFLPSMSYICNLYTYTYIDQIFKKVKIRNRSRYWQKRNKTGKKEIRYRPRHRARKKKVFTFFCKFSSIFLYTALVNTTCVIFFHCSVRGQGRLSYQSVLFLESVFFLAFFLAKTFIPKQRLKIWHKQYLNFFFTKLW